MEPIDWRHGPALELHRPRTLAPLLEQAATRAGDRIVLRDGAQAVTWDDLERLSASVAAAWAPLVAPGDRVAIALANGLPHLVAELACWRLAAVAAPVFTGQNPALITAQITALDPVLAVCSADLAAAVPAGLTCHFGSALLKLPAQTCGWRPADPHTPCLILATSGSTSHARAAILTHDNLCSQQAAFAAIWPEFGPGDRLASYLPWHHSFGGLAERLWSLCRGAEMTLVPGGGRDHDVLLATVRAVAPTVVMSVPKIHQALTKAEVFANASPRWVFTAGATLGPAEEAWYATHGIPVYEGWGLTESSPSATITLPHAPRRPGVVGTPIPGVSVGVRSNGKLVIAGPGVMSGYFRDQRATDHVLGHEPQVGRILETGDLGAWTDAGLRFDGRADLTVKLINGEKVALAHISSALESQPGLRQVVILIDHDRVIALCSAMAELSDSALSAAITVVNQSLASPYMRIQATYRLQTPATCADGLLTPSHKVARGAWVRSFLAWRSSHDGTFRPIACS